MTARDLLCKGVLHLETVREVLIDLAIDFDHNGDPDGAHDCLRGLYALRTAGMDLDEAAENIRRVVALTEEAAE